MKPDQIRIVQLTWFNVTHSRNDVAQMFYDRLFELEPSLRPLFKSDMNVQGKMLVAILGQAVNGLTQLERLVPTVQALGVRHAGYGVESWHYDIVGEVLLWVLEQSLENQFTPAAKEAWAEAYKLLSTVMREAANQTPAASALIDPPAG